MDVLIIGAGVVPPARAGRTSAGGSASRSAAAEPWSSPGPSGIRLSIGYGELAAFNGVRFFFGEPLLDAINAGREVVEVRTPGTVLRPRFVVNAAGLGADEVSRILGGEDFQITARRGEFLLMDREFGRRVPRSLTMMPTERSHGIMVIPPGMPRPRQLIRCGGGLTRSASAAATTFGLD